MSDLHGERPGGPVRVLLADDEEMIRHGVRLILRHAQDIDVVAEAANGAEAVELAARHPVDVALVDIRMPVLDGLAAIEQLVRLDPKPQVVMLTTFGDEENVTRALQAGASGFLLKDEGPQELISAVRAAAAGDAVLSPGVTGHVVRRMLQGGGRIGAGTADERLAALTDREREVLAMLGEGLSNLEIGRRLEIGLGTVKTHVGRILDKTGTESRVQAALLAHQAGLAG
ncbi:MULTISPECIES: response regulator [Streptomyces]|uniref:Response regulator transcription factor n=2 Tax=Streptomyces rimosus subsp. rimosus TaxID=132474 RepID=L8END5_STRR1|nr:MULTISPECIES: response regulator transcription factor [Streptomyces]KOG76833.1 LuxR family transcriptional regulator [Kitasatospora aureofaciens]MYT45025.1 response regulator [Streptomyces sp. SID5471]KEF19684.1 LuxR family transcriptional regulator [Streptomyces rimosus]KOT33769.1 LuxR family transcriptional regulator [Streptomyces rimosus subsp. rimosus]KOT36439.1 LuxR family transcriptional regulator [Streptomyces sp. NRRL WC-3701]